MVGTRYLLGSIMAESDSDIVFLTIKLTRKLRKEFKAAAKVEGVDVSNTLRPFMSKYVREIKEKEPEAFTEALQSGQEPEENVKPRKKLRKVKHDRDAGTVIKNGNRWLVEDVSVEKAEKKNKRNSA
jgi:hypothetical protein